VAIASSDTGANDVRVLNASPNHQVTAAEASPRMAFGSFEHNEEELRNTGIHGSSTLASLTANSKRRGSPAEFA